MISLAKVIKGNVDNFNWLTEIHHRATFHMPFPAKLLPKTTNLIKQILINLSIVHPGCPVETKLFHSF